MFEITAVYTPVNERRALRRIPAVACRVSLPGELQGGYVLPDFLESGCEGWFACGLTHRIVEVLLVKNDFHQLNVVFYKDSANSEKSTKTVDF